MPTVLFLSPDSDLRAVASRVLTMSGCQVTAVAHSGHASLACIEGGDFDVVVIEDGMADASGDAIVGRLQRYCPDAAVIRISDGVIERRRSDDGITVVRPVTADDLIRAVSDATHYARRRVITR
ncbi:MAG: hypothetical protein ABIQ52_14600 [Vicinamibacterales bacterium]